MKPLDRIDSAQRAVSDCQKEADRIRSEAQTECRHEAGAVVLVRGYDGILAYHKPFLVCRDCGYAEEEWGWRGRLHHMQYKSGIPTIASYSEGLKLVRGRVVSRDDKNEST